MDDFTLCEYQYRQWLINYRERIADIINQHKDNPEKVNHFKKEQLRIFLKIRDNHQVDQASHILVSLKRSYNSKKNSNGF